MTKFLEEEVFILVYASTGKIYRTHGPCTYIWFDEALAHKARNRHSSDRILHELKSGSYQYIENPHKLEVKKVRLLDIC